MKILNYGSMNIDNVYQVEHMIHPGETQMAIAKNVFAGGKGLNQSIAIAKAGGTVYHAGVVGEDGAYCMRGDEILYQPAFPVQPVDTTAAGDTFTGYFVTGLSHDEDLSKVMERAAKAAAITVSRAGTAESIPYANEV